MTRNDAVRGETRRRVRRPLRPRASNAAASDHQSLSTRAARQRTPPTSRPAQQPTTLLLRWLAAPLASGSVRFPVAPAQVRKAHEVVQSRRAKEHLLFWPGRSRAATPPEPVEKAALRQNRYRPTTLR